jgi:metal-dependent amidase/aminoacylase/carboxypeptidase family protein
VHRRINEIATNIAESAGAKAEVNILKLYPATVNDEVLTATILPSLAAAAGKENLILMDPMTGSEDFSFFFAGPPIILSANPHESFVKVKGPSATIVSGSQDDEFWVFPNNQNDTNVFPVPIFE